MTFYRLQNEYCFNKKKRIVDTDVINDVSCTRQNVITGVVIQSVAINVSSNFEFPLTYVYFHVYFLIFCK